MKELNDNNDPTVLCNNEISVLSSEENPESSKEGKNQNEEPNLNNISTEDFKSDLIFIDRSSSLKDLIDKDGKSEAEVSKSESELNKLEPNNSKAVETGVKKDNKDITKKKLILRPRKIDANQNTEENLKKKRSKKGNEKTEIKSAIKKGEENNFSCHEISLVCETDTILKLNSNLKVVTQQSISGNVKDNANLIENKAESIQCNENSKFSSVKDEDDNENMFVVKCHDISANFKSNDILSKGKDNSESETRISSASENSFCKAPKKRRRRRDIRWTKKRKRNDGNHIKGQESNLLIPVGYGLRETENPSSLSNENFTNGKKKYTQGSENSQKKSREFAIPSPSLADISMKPAVPESTATSFEAAKPNLCLCKKKPQVFISGNNNTGDLYCQALDCIDNRVVGCCNPIPSQDVGLFRASERASYQMMCDVHQQRLCRHNCCPGCGLFCTQGKYLMCKSLHYFHKTCSVENENDMIVCPHCGDDTPPKTVIVSIHSPKDPVFLPHQKPLRNMKSAKMSITRGNIEILEAEDCTFQFPSSFFNIVGPEDSPSNGLIQSLQRDKLAHLLNIACRSFSKMCCSSRYSYKSLYNASQSGDAEKLLKIIASGLNPNHVFEENNKQTALHIAAANGNLSIVHILLQAKAQINVLDGEQNTPLTAAINAKHNDVVKYLIKCGADLTLKSEDGMIPLHIAAKSGNVGACYHLLNGTHLPSKYIDSLDDGGWTPMVWASEFNHLEVVKFLITKGADPLIKDAEQNIALHWAAFGGSIDIVELYLNDGSDINSVNVHGDTPLHIAARQDKYSCVLLLLARGARSDIKNKSGELPRDCSESPMSDIYKGISLNMEISALLTRFQDRTPKVITNDISKGRERNQIQCVNGVDDEQEPRDYIYISESCFTSKISVDRTINSLQCCKCQENCSLDGCNCATISIKCWYDNDGRLGPDFNYSDPPMIFECNQACQCNRITCRNRVVQNGISCRFQLFRTEGKGWGIKTLNLIPKGTYVCEYIGEIISDCEADHREDDSYLFDLDNRDGETYCIDARHYGNFARFINHMCVPNLMPVHVFVDHQDLRFPRIAFFANRDILPDEELGYNYGEKFWVIKWKSFTCTCGAEKCIYSESTIQTTLENYRKKIEENP